MKKKHSKQFTVLFYCLLLLVILLFIGPIIWMIMLSLKTKTEIFTYPPKLFPEVWSIENYLHIIKNSRIPTYLFNSFKITLFATLGNLLVTIPAAFAFSRFRFPFRKQLLFVILMFQMISQLIIAIPLYRYFIQLGMLNSHFGLILVYITVQVPFATWVLKGFFDSIPIQLDEAAIIDGYNEYQTLIYILLPLAMPGIATALVFNTINAWGNFIIPFIFINDSMLFPISVGILNFADTQTEGEITIHLMATASVLGLIPALVIIVGLQRLIVGALTAGAVKE
ncbi:carbohydrate ABC transporter permease [uncultured Sphaerochaeta sp.]|uniref:carbohydrate ABC transporter permease n=1 Tax=uncultured Sphaerochaeta sp. TaxID=886478 RepID=UPI002AA6A5A9|nr:carbohydrate ABC transporter permease [uncultured Sphaerochaeta sp.]